MTAPQVLTFIIGCIVVISGAYFATYLVARGSQKVYRGRLIQVLDRFSLAKDKSLVLVAVYDKIYLVAFAAGNVTLLDNIDPATAAALAADYLKPEDKPNLPGNMLALLRARLRRPPWKKSAKAAPETVSPYEAYLPAQADSAEKPASFFSIMQDRLEKEERHEEGNS
jgi:flagellar biogenesis protein FliO